MIYLEKNRYIYKLNVSIYNDSVFHMGQDNYMNNTLTVILSGQKHCYIGDNGIFHGEYVFEIRMNILFIVARQEKE